MFLQWDHPLDDGNRSDVFYTISENISSSSNTNNTMATTFTMQNLIPFVYYEIRVTAENGVSSQDPWIENRSLTISVMTLEGSKYMYICVYSHISGGYLILKTRLWGTVTDIE